MVELTVLLKTLRFQDLMDTMRPGGVTKIHETHGKTVRVDRPDKGYTWLGMQFGSVLDWSSYRIKQHLCCSQLKQHILIN